MNNFATNEAACQPWVVLYWDSTTQPADPPRAFTCRAKGMDKAEARCKEAKPGCVIAWALDTDSVEAAYADYWNIEPASVVLTRATAS